MHTGKRYGPLEVFLWTRRDLYWIILISVLATLPYALGFCFVSLPWQPVALLGTAVAFIIGFKNNASYNRVWEARQIYGSIVNDSRALGYTLRDALGSDLTGFTREMFYRHFAWLTALRYQLREPKVWENTQLENNREFRGDHQLEIPEWDGKIEAVLGSYLSASDLQYVMGKKNRATQLMAMQSDQLASLRRGGYLNDFQWTQLQQFLVRLTESQGRAERIKNFPYPRNFASMATYLIFLFIVLLPFGLMHEFDRLGQGTVLEGYSIWLNVPFSAMISWAFHTLDTVGESSVNPFEGNANDIPITQISRAIEIDLRDMLDEAQLPAPLVPYQNILL